MGTFDSLADSPFQIKTEGEKITLTFSPGKPTTGQGTVAWNIPSPAHGCQVNDGRGAYGGMVILVSNTPLTAKNIPVNGTYYTADPTVDSDTHAGDKIGGALVIGAFYESEKKSQGLTLTTSFVVSDLKPNTSYYVAGYAVDYQGRYHSDGVRAYSDQYGNTDQPNKPSKQFVRLGNGVLPTDGTTLVPGAIYKFDVRVDENFPEGTTPTVIPVTIKGINAGTYEQLITEINKQLSLGENPPQSPVAPNTGYYFWDAIEKILYQFDGTVHNPVTTALIEPTDPADVASGDYWYDTDAEILYRRDVPAPGWNVVEFFAYHQDPRDLECNDYWYDLDDEQAYLWNGSTWCEQETFVTTNCPNMTPVLECGTYWYDSVNNELKEWNVDQQQWVERFAIMWDINPLTLDVGTYWFNLTEEVLSQWDGLAWEELTASIQDAEPTTPANDALWYSPTSEQLQQWNSTSSEWEPLDVLVWPEDPTVITSCDLWWRTTDDTLFVRDVVNNEWDEVAAFTQSDIDPSLAPVLGTNVVWYSLDDEQLKRWDGSEWIDVTFISFNTDPTLPSTGVAWYNTTTSVWQVWNTPTVSQWNVVDPIDSATDPTLITQGRLWFDTTTSSLFQRIGLAWISIPFTTMPLFPAKGDIWFDTTNFVLKTWNGTAWVVTSPLAVASLFDGHLKFETTGTGSNMCIMILIPGDSVFDGFVGTGYANFAMPDLQGHAFGHHGPFGGEEAPELTITDVTDAEFLFNFLPNTTVLSQTYGTDGVSGTPSYDQLDVGDDGTPDERRELIDSIRQQLGYPVVQVELTHYQLDTAVQGALESFRKRSSLAYKRGFFFLDVHANQQRYKLSNRKIGFHKIVTIMAAYRFTSAFLGSAHGAGVYGQVVLQHLYNMGTYDLTSFHLVAQYIEQLEHLFATRLTYHWDEPSRNLDFYHSFTHPERVLLDCTVERTEQELLVDRWSKGWLERYALAEAMTMLANIRGKYASLPGAGGGISLNASELMQTANDYRTELMQQLDDFLVQDPEDIGLGSTFIIG